MSKKDVKPTKDTKQILPEDKLVTSHNPVSPKDAFLANFKMLASLGRKTKEYENLYVKLTNAISSGITKVVIKDLESTKIDPNLFYAILDDGLYLVKERYILYVDVNESDFFQKKGEL